MNADRLSRIFQPRDRIKPFLVSQGIRWIAMRLRSASNRLVIPPFHAIQQTHRPRVRQQFAQFVFIQQRHGSTIN